jgi:glycosyltransferase involved in cell wall biosynthesis
MKVASLGLDDLVDLVGHISDAEIPGVLACSHVGLFASRQSLAERGFEGFGLVVHELAAAGLPVLVGDAAGAPDAALEPWARLVDPDDLWAWVEAVEDFFANEERRLALGDSALRWAAAIGANDPAQNFARRLLGRSRGAAR